MSDAGRGDEQAMAARAIALAAAVRRTTAPNPWVGAVVVTRDGQAHEGATEPPGGRHAEIVALDAARAAGVDTAGATIYVTLEPCVHHGRTGPCTDALVAAGIARVVAAIEDPDPQVSGKGLAALRAAGVEVTEGVEAASVEDQLAAYRHHRLTGRPLVVLKLAATLDGRTAAPDGSSQWITGQAARADAHGLRADSDAVIVGAGTVRADDPSLTVRLADGPDPLRVVLGTAPPGARVHPALELSGSLAGVLDDLGRRGVLQVLVEGGATVAGDFHRAGLVDRYVVYLAPAFLGGDDGRPLLAGPGATTIDDLWRGRITAVTRLGDDVRIDLGAGEVVVFTGIVEELGSVAGRDGARLRIAATQVVDGAAIGDSIAVNGCCLTVVALGDGWLEADVSDETFARTNLVDVVPGDPLNLERPVRLADRLGGHLVQGHVDGVGAVVDPVPDLRVKVPDGLGRYLVEKCSVTVDGVSLTVVQALADEFTVAVIPHTAAVTTLGRRRVGDRVNLEVDVVAKYVERLLAWKD